MKILIADDELRLRKVVAMFLKKSGHEVIEAVNGEQALEFLQTIVPDIIILDVNMPVMGGFETCKAIKSNPNLENIPVLLLTANVNSEDRESGEKAGANEYVTKPFSPKELLEKIELYTSK